MSKSTATTETESAVPVTVTVELTATIRQGVIMRQSGERIEISPSQAKWLEDQGKAKVV